MKKGVKQVGVQNCGSSILGPLISVFDLNLLRFVVGYIKKVSARSALSFFIYLKI